MGRRAVVALVVVVMVAAASVLFVQGARARSFTADRHRRAQEIAAREPHLHRQLANQHAVLESQRRVYVERLRRLETRLRQREDDVALLRARLVATSSRRSHD